MSEARVPLLRLYEKTSKHGRTYFTGRMGLAKVVMFKDERAEGTDPVWELFVSEAPANGQGQASTFPASAHNQGQHQSRRYDPTSREARAANKAQAPEGSPPLDDRVDDLYPAPGR
jgi:hypothetical protein